MVKLLRFKKILFKKRKKLRKKSEVNSILGTMPFEKKLTIKLINIHRSHILQ